MLMDLGKVRKVEGLVTQVRDDVDEYVRTFRVQHSTDGAAWKDVDGTFRGVSSMGWLPSEKLEATFRSGVDARYVKILPQTWQNHISLRAGVLACEEPDDVKQEGKQTVDLAAEGNVKTISKISGDVKP